MTHHPSYTISTDRCCDNHNISNDTVTGSLELRPSHSDIVTVEPKIENRSNSAETESGSSTITPEKLSIRKSIIFNA